MAGAAVRFEGVTKAYGSHLVLQPTTLTIGQGEFFAIIGPSGSGKSTLLGIVAGFSPPTGGAVSIDGRNVLALPPYRRQLGMVFQGYALFPHMSVADNVAFPLKMRRRSREEIGRRVKEALAMVRLDSFADRYPSQLSGGQQQRVALARAAVYHPALLLMDEPLGALDKNLREEMQDEIKRFQTSLGATVLYVTHDQQEAAFLADRLAVMRAGRIEQVGTPRDIYDRPANRFVAGFLGEATILPIVDRPGSGQGMMARCEGGLVTALPDPSAPGRAICLRPENIMLGEAAAACDNRFDAVVTEAIFTTGTVRYRVRVENGPTLTLRTPAHPGLTLAKAGERLAVGWPTSSVSLLDD